MKIPELKIWIEHLSNPLVYMGFIVLLALLFLGKLPVSKPKRFHMTLLWAGAVIIVAELAGLAFIVLDKAGKKGFQSQETFGSGAPAVQSQGDVTIDYSDRSTVREATSPETSKAPSTESQDGATQTTHGPEAPAVRAGGKVNIHY